MDPRLADDHPMTGHEEETTSTNDASTQTCDFLLAHAISSMLSKSPMMQTISSTAHDPYFAPPDPNPGRTPHSPENTSMDTLRTRQPVSFPIDEKDTKKKLHDTERLILTTNLWFHALEDCRQYLRKRAMAKGHGVVKTIANGKKIVDSDGSAVHRKQKFVCERSRRPTANPTRKTDVCKSKRCECPWRAAAHYNMARKMWGIAILCDEHNHPDIPKGQSTHYRHYMQEVLERETGVKFHDRIETLFVQGMTSGQIAAKLTTERAPVTIPDIKGVLRKFRVEQRGPYAPGRVPPQQDNDDAGGEEGQDGEDRQDDIDALVDDHPAAVTTAEPTTTAGLVPLNIPHQTAVPPSAAPPAPMNQLPLPQINVSTAQAPITAAAATMTIPSNGQAATPRLPRSSRANPATTTTTHTPPPSARQVASNARSTRSSVRTSHPHGAAPTPNSNNNNNNNNNIMPQRMANPLPTPTTRPTMVPGSIPDMNPLPTPTTTPAPSVVTGSMPPPFTLHSTTHIPPPAIPSMNGAYNGGQVFQPYYY